MKQLQIEYLSTDKLRIYQNNAKIHTTEQIEQIKQSIEQFGFNDPIAVWKKNEIIEGHGRLLAAKELGLKEVPIIRLDKLSDEERRAYMLVHNQLTMNTGFNYELLDIEIENLNIDMQPFGFDSIHVDFGDIDRLFEDAPVKEKEAQKIQCPHCKEWFEV